MKRKLRFVLMGMFLVGLVLGCSLGGSSSNTTANPDQTAAQAFVNGVTLVMHNDGAWGGTSTSPSSAICSFSATGLNMNGTLTNMGTASEVATLNLTFSNYPDASGYTVSGSGNLTMTFNDSTLVVSAGTLTANLTYSGGSVTSATANITFTGNMTLGTTPTNLAFAGTFTADGTSYNVSGFGLQTLSSWSIWQ